MQIVIANILWDITIPQSTLFWSLCMYDVSIALTCTIPELPTHVLGLVDKTKAYYTMIGLSVYPLTRKFFCTSAQVRYIFS